MGSFKKVFNSLDITSQCREYNIRIWQCPQFLFLVMGFIIIVAIIATNIVARRFVAPEIVALIVLAVTAILFVLSHIIISSFERMAESSKSKSEFISIMSHRLRSPLSAIKWHLDLLIARKSLLSEEETKSSLSAIEGENEKMIRIVNDLLELNNIEDGNLMLSASCFSLVKLAEDAVHAWENALDSAPKNVFVSAPDSLPDVFADKIKIKSVLFCLFDNALKYGTKEGKISVSLERFSDYVRCSVNDEGAGIQARNKKKVFSKFFRGDGILHYRTEGTGIGLFIAKNIVEQSGGKMDFNSIDGRGSTFWFTLPVAKTTDSA